MKKPTEPEAKKPSADECLARIESHLLRLGIKGLDVQAHLMRASQNKITELESIERLLAQAVALKRGAASVAHQGQRPRGT